MLRYKSGIDTVTRTQGKTAAALVLLNVGIRLYCAFNMIISDCDETFNYWEPLNLLVRGFGKQTWEYSPEYAIRSYAYLLPYYIVNYPLSLLLSPNILNLPSYYQFYWIRAVALCGFTSFTEIRLFYSLRSNFGHKIADWFIFFSSISAGMSHAGVALLPSSFAMNCITLAIANSLPAMMSSQPGIIFNKSVTTISWFLLGGIVGWPFVLVLALPFCAFTVLNRFSQPQVLMKIIAGSIVRLVGILTVIVGVDSYFYQKRLLLVPLNIVLYNVFGGEGEGPEIFGVEDFSYYLLNLLVNFNAVFILGFAGLVLNPFIFNSRYEWKIVFGVSLPLLIWSVIFGSQPHKEERFLYPIYPFIILSASLLTAKIFDLISVLFQIVGKLNGERISKYLNTLLQLAFAFLITLVSILRLVNLVNNYGAPLRVSSALAYELDTTEMQNVCVGREWYHFPTSFFLPENHRLQFIKSGFDGLLPGDFMEGNGSLVRSTSRIPEDMNNKNQFSISKVIDFERCSYYIDNSQNTDVENGEPRIFERESKHYFLHPKWSELSCDKLINPDGKHSGLGRLLYVPEFLRDFISYDVKYMDFCILKRSDLKRCSKSGCSD